jgi:PAS domain S-box-containing protein
MYYLIIGATLALQITAAYLASSLLNRLGKHASRKIIISVALVMAVRQCIVLYRSLSGEALQHDPAVEVTTFIVSALMVYWTLALREDEDSLETARRLQTAVSSGNLGIWDWDIRNNKLLWDDRMTDLYDLSRESRPGRIEDWRTLLHRDDREQAWEECMAALRGDRDYDTEFRVTRRNGSVKVIKANGLVIRDRDGIAVRMVGLNRDITEQRWAEREIVSLNETLERRVAERTQQLEKANANLRAEIDERIGVEKKLKNHTAHLKIFSSRLMEARESERRHIAHELHDEIGQELTGLKLALDRLRRAADGTTAKGLQVIQEQVESLMSRARDLSFNLRPSLLDDLGLVPALKWLFSRYTEQTGVRVDFHHDGKNRRFLPEIEIVLFRVIQEALTNAARYAGVDEAFVSLEVHEFTVVACIEDKGTGFHPDEILKAGVTLGITGIRERVEDAGGSVRIQSEPERGTQLTITIPLMCPLQDHTRSESHSCA